MSVFSIVTQLIILPKSTGLILPTKGQEIIVPSTSKIITDYRGEIKDLDHYDARVAKRFAM